MGANRLFCCPCLTNDTFRLIDMNRDYEILSGQRIKFIRDSRKMTQEAVVTQLQLLGCDITRSALGKIEVGQRHIYPDEIHAIKNVLNVSYDELLPD